MERERVTGKDRGWRREGKREGGEIKVLRTKNLIYCMHSRREKRRREGREEGREEEEEGREEEGGSEGGRE